MRMSFPTRSLHFLAFAGSLALGACAVAPTDDSSTQSQNLSGSGGGGGESFSCDGTQCTCSKEIEGDCDRMRINCWDTEGLDSCIEGWATTDCSCPETPARTTTTSPIRSAIPTRAVTTR